MTAYYNEIEPYAVEWLRNLIRKGLIADGIVDDRSIASVEASDLGDFTQCHFFAGIGVWSHALRLAGWPDDRPVWTGSCPCQPFSAAGKGKGFDDERHLWPEFHRLISQCAPPVVFGEQVASKDGLAWLDTVHADLQASDYAFGAVDWCAAGVGAPHIRQRLWFVGERLADADRGRQRQRTEHECGAAQPEQQAPQRDDIGGRGGLSRLGHHHQGLEGQRSGHQAEGGRLGAVRPVAEAGEPRGMADAGEGGREILGASRLHGDGQPGHDGAGRGEAGRMADADDAKWSGQFGLHAQDGRHARQRDRGARHHTDEGLARPGPTNGHWRAADWLHCRDGKWRPVEPGTFPLAHGAPARVGRLRAYGNAIVGQAAKEFIAAFMECRP